MQKSITKSSINFLPIDAKQPAFSEETPSRKQIWQVASQVGFLANQLASFHSFLFLNDDRKMRVDTFLTRVTI